MHTILGAGGPISKALTEELSRAGNKIRLVSRREVKTSHTNICWQKGDLTNPSDVRAAVKGSDVVYLCAGLKYDTKVWENEWPRIIQNVIAAVKTENTRLIFFDNVYMYGKVEGQMTEETAYNPISKKGEIRARIANALMEEVKVGNIRASIARAPDFYGATNSLNSFFDMMVLDKLSKKQKPMWLGNPETKHTFIYVRDAAKGMFILGQSPQSDNQIWHLPSAKAQTGKNFLEMAANAFSTKANFMKVNKLMLQCLGLFTPTIKESVEMYYQYQYDYDFSSQKFEKVFSVLPTSYLDGIGYIANTSGKR